MSKKELLERLSEIDEKILSLLDPLEISELVIERGRLLEVIPQINLDLDDCHKIEIYNKKIMQHLKNIELELKRRLKDARQYSVLYKNYYLSSYKLKDSLLSEKV